MEKQRAKISIREIQTNGLITQDQIDLHQRLQDEKRQRALLELQAQYSKHTCGGSYEEDRLTLARNYADFCDAFEVQGRGKCF